MIRYVCSVKDSATQLYGQPFMVAATGAAVRNFMDEVRRAAPDNSLYMHPEDFELWMIATFNDENGVYEQHGMEMLIRGKDCVVTKEANHG